MARDKKNKKGFRVELSGPQLTMWCVVMFILLAWSFILGILVGRGSIPDKLKHLASVKKDLSRLKQVDTTQGQNKVPIGNVDKSDEPEKFDFFQKLAEKKEDRVTPVRQLTTHVHKGKANQDRRPITAASNVTRYTVQVASFTSRQKASSLVQRLTNKGLDAYYVIAETTRGRYYRVRCGDYGSRQEALSKLSVISAATGLKGFVCRK